MEELFASKIITTENGTYLVNVSATPIDEATLEAVLSEGVYEDTSKAMDSDYKKRLAKIIIPAVGASVAGHFIDKKLWNSIDKEQLEKDKEQLRSKALMGELIKNKKDKDKESVKEQDQITQDQMEKLRDKANKNRENLGTAASLAALGVTAYGLGHGIYRTVNLYKKRKELKEKYKEKYKDLMDHDY